VSAVAPLPRIADVAQAVAAFNDAAHPLYADLADEGDELLVYAWSPHGPGEHIAAYVVLGRTETEAALAARMIATLEALADGETPPAAPLERTRRAPLRLNLLRLRVGQVSAPAPGERRAG